MPEVVIVDGNGEEHIFPEGMDPKKAADIVRQRTATPPPTEADAGGSTLSSMLGSVPDMLPSIGGLIGGMAGKTAGAGIPLAAIGGAAGEGYKQLINNASQIGPAIGDIFTNLTSGDPSVMGATIGGAYQGGREGFEAAADQAAIQGGSEATGRGLMTAAKGLGKGAMSLGMYPSKAIRSEFGDVAATAIKERIPVGKVPGSSKAPGSQRMAARRDAQSGVTDLLLTQAGQAGITIPPQSMLKSATALRNRISHRPIAQPTVKALNGLMRDYMTEHSVPNMVSQQVQVPSSVLGPGGSPMTRTVTKQVQSGRVPTPMSPMDVKLMKQIAQAESAPIIRAEAKGSVTPTAERLNARFERAMGRDAKSALENMPMGFGRKVADSEAKTQSFIGAQRALGDAELRRNYLNPFEGRMVTVGGLSTIGGLGGGAAYMSEDNKLQNALTTMIATRLVMDPRFLSRVGLGLTHPGTQAVLQNLPRAGVALTE